MPLKVKIVRRKKKTTVARARRNTLNRPQAPNSDAPIRPGFKEKTLPNQKSNRSLEGTSNTLDNYSVSNTEGSWESMGSIPENNIRRPRPMKKAPRPPPKSLRKKKNLSITTTDEHGIQLENIGNPSPLSVPNKQRSSIMSNESLGSPTAPDESKLKSKKKSLFRVGTDTKWEDNDVENLHDEMQAQLDLLKKTDTQSSLRSSPRSYLEEEDYSGSSSVRSQKKRLSKNNLDLKPVESMKMSI